VLPGLALAAPVVWFGSEDTTAAPTAGSGRVSHAGYRSGRGRRLRAPHPTRRHRHLRGNAPGRRLGALWGGRRGDRLCRYCGGRRGQVCSLVPGRRVKTCGRRALVGRDRCGEA